MLLRGHMRRLRRVGRWWIVARIPRLLLVPMLLREPGLLITGLWRAIMRWWIPSWGWTLRRGIPWTSRILRGRGWSTVSGKRSWRPRRRLILTWVSVSVLIRRRLRRRVVLTLWRIISLLWWVWRF
jgi:hypothetical protein